MAVDGGVSGVSSVLAIRSSVGIELWASSGIKSPYEHKSNLPREETKNSRSISFSPDGRYFAYTNGHEIKVLQTSDWQHKCSLPRPKAFYLKFSPRGNYLCTWEMYTVTKDRPDGSPNMYVYDMTNGAEVFAIVQKQQTDWEPSWSSDETIFAMVAGGEALFYDLDGEHSKAAAGFKTTARRIGGSRGGVLSLGPGSSPPFLAFYTPGSKGAPSMCKLYKYPALAQNQMVACKSFFQADRVEMLWNKRGSGLLLLTSTEVDKSGASYYGNQALHFMATKGDSCSVPLAKDGPVHCVKWSPKATEFVVVYGFMPSKAALYNLKCDVVFDFGEGPRNCAYFNPFGNLLVLAGFGNLPGNVEIWDVKKKEKLANIKCADSTYFDWHPNGAYFITATTAPRLRIGNGFKIYHYSGALVHETIWPQGQELLGVEWQQFPEDTFDEPEINKLKHESIKSSQPEASKKAYTPPHLRLMKEGKNPEQFLPQPQANLPGSSPGYNTQSHNKKGSGSGSGNPNNKSQHKPKPKKDISGAAAFNRADRSPQSNGSNEMPSEQQQHSQRSGNRRLPPQQQQHAHRNAPNKQPIAHTADTTVSAVANNNNNNGANNQAEPTQQQQQQTITNTNSSSSQPTPAALAKKVANPEKDKKIRNVAKKLSDIKKLKSRQEKGETLELNQLNKISLEAKFLEELKALKSSA